MFSFWVETNNPGGSSYNFTPSYMYEATSNVLKCWEISTKDKKVY